tara:strand:- start:20343 stop:20573 length:231 start_codon:yes stop_codon:yes gene_type:complete
MGNLSIEATLLLLRIGHALHDYDGYWDVNAQYDIYKSDIGVITDDDKKMLSEFVTIEETENSYTYTLSDDIKEKIL